MNEDLHGMVPDKSDVALILIDVINDLEFPDSELLLEHALPMADKIAALKKRAGDLEIPVIYANDNFGRWRSDFRANLEHCLKNDVLGRPIVQKLIPEEDDYFVLKAKHSAFFSSNLDILLDYLKTKTLILVGVAGNICVLFTANDAYMRDFRIFVPRDCIASNSVEDNETALHLMETVLKADTTPSTELDLEEILRESRKEDAGHPEPQPERRQAK